MAKQTGLGDQLLVDGNDIGGDIGSIQRVSGGPSPLDLSAITQEAFDREGGKRTGGIEFNSWFNPDRAHPVLSELPTADRIITYLRGEGVGAPAASCVAKQIDYGGNRNQDGSLAFTVAAESNGYGVEWGRQLTAGVRTDTAATDGASLDGGASSTHGAQAYLQVRAVTGVSVTVTLQDSADNSSWANITGGAFSAATGVGAQRLAITGTVRRYVRAVSSGTFSNAEFAVQFVRNATEVTF